MWEITKVYLLMVSKSRFANCGLGSESSATEKNLAMEVSTCSCRTSARTTAESAVEAARYTCTPVFTLQVQ